MYFRSQKKLGNEVSIHEVIDTDKDGNPLTYIDVVSSEDTIAEDLDLKIKSARAIKIIHEELTEREQEIIIGRYGLGSAPAATQREIADRMGISRSYVSRIEKSALKKLHDRICRPGFYLF
ncbi:MAG: sigma-70 family RNA polymerase sigma factor [Ruminococcaceae bacterium]|nr:sigma-70 family RNA polymerase sigma factor [Oscillospiraceae bacterium]